VRRAGAERATSGTQRRRVPPRDGWRAFLRNGRSLTEWVLGTTVAFHLLYLVPLTHELAEDLLDEDRAVEIVTAVALLLAAGLGVVLAFRARRAGRPFLVWGFYLAFAALVFVIGMEEISWGQWIFFWNTPEAVKEINGQGETNLHNIGGLQGKSEWFRFGFVMAALVGVLCSRRTAFREIATPSSLIGPLFVVFGYVLVDIVDDLFAGVPWIITTFSSMSEWVEMLIGLIALAYVLIKRDDFATASASGP
jgi:hypothetical protein